VRPDRSLGRSLEAFKLGEAGTTKTLREFVDRPPVRRQHFVIEGADLIRGEAAGNEHAVVGDGASQFLESNIELRGFLMDK
jgi:hypothetical protein